MLAAKELVEKIRSYHPEVNEILITDVYNFAKEKHSNQVRSSGEPYFSHPLAVCEILIEMKMDQYTICTALLHDVVEDTDVSVSTIKTMFGEDIARLVNGVTKLNKIKYREHKDNEKKNKQALNFIKLIVSLASNIRVLIVKLADRLHNMRTIQFIPSEEKKNRIAAETLNVYARLAERMGMQNILDELQDIAFKVLHKKERAEIMQKLVIGEKRNEDIDNIIKCIRNVLTRKEIDAEICGRMKTPYSIWKKMHKRNVSFDELTDIMAFRIIVQNVDECYKAFCIIHTSFQAILGKVKDYISLPKLNGYRSLHTVVVGPFNQKIEIQIKTVDMHEVAETGVAAHWSYKENLPINKDPSSSKYKWIRDLLSVIDKNACPVDIFENSMAEMFKWEIQCFTPQGDLIPLPLGATCLDMAYAIHTFVGNTCMKAKINGTMMPLNTVLNSGDKVEIITSPHQSPSKEWLEFVITGKARACIKKYVKLKERSEYVVLGHSLLKQILGDHGNEFDEMYVAEKLQEKFSCKNRNSFYMKLGKGFINLQSVKDFTKNLGTMNEGDSKNIFKKKDNAIYLTNSAQNYLINHADCCSPIPGDEVIGVLVKNEGVVVHKVGCENLNIIDLNSIVKVAWNQNFKDFFVSKIEVIVLNQPGSIVQIAKIISSYGINVNGLKTLPYDIGDFITIEITLEVNDISILEKICAALRTNIRVKSVARG